MKQRKKEGHTVYFEKSDARRICYDAVFGICESVSKQEYANRLENRIKKFIPREGNVRLLCVTEKQYSDMKLLVGSPSIAETVLGTERLIIL